MTRRSLFLSLLASLALAACSADDAASDGSGWTIYPGRASDSALAIFAELESEADASENIVYSPVSAEQAFGLVQLGAAGETAAQIEQILNVSQGVAGAATLRYLRTELTEDTQGVTVLIANALFLSDAYRFASGYLTNAAKFYAAKTQRLDFSGNPGGAIAAMNDWANEATDGMVPQVVDQQSLNRDAAAYLANATFFEGNWAMPFRGGKLAPFLFGDGSEQDFYLMEGRLSVPYIANPNWHAIRLSYGDVDSGDKARFVMDVIIPSQRTATSVGEANEVISKTGTDLDSAQAQNVHVWMPRFQADMRRDLIEPLQAIGLTLPFDPDRGDLSGMQAAGERRLYIDEAFQVAKLEVHEEGTRAAAVTMAVPVPVSVPPPFKGEEFTVDRPFLFVIRDLRTKTILFIGRIASPEPYFHDSSSLDN